MGQVRRVGQRLGIGALSLLVTGGVGLALAGSAAGLPAPATRYVATGGDDGGEVVNDCLQAAHPCKTVQHAVDEAVDGDTVSIATGTYSQSVAIQKSLTLTGASDGSTTLTGTTGPTVQIQPAAEAQQPPAVTLEHLGFLNNASGPGVAALATDLTISDSAISGNVDTGVLVFVGSLRLEDSVVDHTTVSPKSESVGLPGTGVLVAFSTAAIERSVLSDNKDAGLTIFGGSTGPVAAAVDGPSVPQAIVSVTRSTVSGNQVGGIVNEGGQLTVDTSTVSENVGGGIVAMGGAAAIRNSTITKTSPFAAGDSGTEEGGLIVLKGSSGGGGVIVGSVTAQRAAAGKLLSEQLAGRAATVRAASRALQSVASAPVTSGVTVSGSIVAGQAGLADCFGPATDAGYNLSSDHANSCAFAAGAHSLSKTDPKLLPLDDNGGPTPTHLLGKGSPAIDAIPPGQAGCSADATDQRGEPRLQPTTGRCDVGAVEMAAKPIVIHPATLPHATAGKPYKQVFTATGGAYPTYTWSLAPGSKLPEGLTLTSGGVLSGTPTKAGTYTFTVSVNDPVLKAVTLVVDAAAAPAGSGQHPIADTGAPTGALSAVGGGAVVAGLLALLGAARIGRRIGRHRA